MVRNIARNRSKQPYRRHVPLTFEPEARFETKTELNIPDELKPTAILLMNGATKTDTAAILGITTKTLKKRIERIKRAVASVRLAFVRQITLLFTSLAGAVEVVDSFAGTGAE